MASVRVSDHAVIRYLERVLGIDVDEIRKQMVPENTAQMAAALRYGRFPVQAFRGYRLIVREGVVCTVIPGTHRNEERDSWDT